jgi:hypothetical protein
MEYRGKQYTIVQGVGPDSWRWTVHLDEKTIKSGQATSRSAAMTSVVWLIDKALEPRKVAPDAPLRRTLLIPEHQCPASCHKDYPGA